MAISDRLERERLNEITSSLIETITSPIVVETMRQFREKARAGAGFAEAGELMSLESLRAAGAKLPDDFRLTSRVFEDRATGLAVEIKSPRGADKGALAAESNKISACAGGGAATVCGCAGGGT